MQTTLEVALRSLACSIFAAGAVWLALEGTEGWGWCVFAAIVLSDSPIVAVSRLIRRNDGNKNIHDD